MTLQGDLNLTKEELINEVKASIANMEKLFVNCDVPGWMQQHSRADTLPGGDTAPKPDRRRTVNEKNLFFLGDRARWMLGDLQAIAAGDSVFRGVKDDAKALAGVMVGHIGGPLAALSQACHAKNKRLEDEFKAVSSGLIMSA